VTDREPDDDPLAATASHEMLHAMMAWDGKARDSGATANERIDLAAGILTHQMMYALTLMGQRAIEVVPDARQADAHDHFLLLVDDIEGRIDAELALVRQSKPDQGA
jgi:hypothetical protein